MRIEIHHIPSQGTTLQFEKQAHHFLSLKELAAEGACRFVSPIDISLNVVPEKDFFKVAGKIKVTLGLVCVRCLTDFDASLSRRFLLNYSRQIIDDVHTSDTEAEELTAQQIGMSYFKGDEIDFTDAVQEQVVLAMPYRPLCHEDCKGLCPRCGNDLNETGCQCDREDQNSPFAVLKDMKLRP